MEDFSPILIHITGVDLSVGSLANIILAFLPPRCHHQFDKYFHTLILTFDIQRVGAETGQPG